VFVCIAPGKAVPEMTYTVSCGTLNPTHSLTLTESEIWPVFHWISYPSSSNPQFENVSHAASRWNFAFPSFTHMVNYSCTKFSLTT